MQAVIFDVDGTLVDSVDLHATAWCEAFSLYGKDIPFAKMRHKIGKGADQLMPDFLSEGELHSFGKDLEQTRKQLFQEKYLPEVKGFPMVRQLFQKLLNDDLKVVLASSAAGEELSTYKKRAGITDLVEDETSKDEAPKSKPHPDIFQAAMSKLEGIQPGGVIVIGDTPYDAEAARKAGLRVIGVLSGGFPETELRQAGCCAIYQGPADLLQQYPKWLVNPSD